MLPYHQVQVTDDMLNSLHYALDDAVIAAIEEQQEPGLHAVSYVCPAKSILGPGQ